MRPIPVVVAEATGLLAEAETRILSSIMPELFCRDVAEIAACRVYADHKMFRSDQRMGAFRYWDAG